jgi:hypothetical protein
LAVSLGPPATTVLTVRTIVSGMAALLVLVQR